MRSANERRVWVLGGILCFALTICSRYFYDRGGPLFMVTLTIGCAAYLLAVRELFAASRFPRRIVVFGLVVAAVWHVAFLQQPPGNDDDIHRYVWDGRLQNLGYSPYLIVPNDPNVKELHTAETRSLNNPNLPSPYPAGAQTFFRVVTTIQESVLAFKVAFFVCEFAIVLLLLDLLRLTGRGVHLVLVFAWNPLLAIEVTGSGHIDIVCALFLVASAVALVRRWRASAAVALALAIAVKFVPVVLVPVYWKRVRVRDVAIALAVVGLLYVPFLRHGHIPFGSLGTYVQTFRFNGPVFATLARVAPPPWVAGLAILVGIATAGWLRSRAPEWSPAQFAWPIAASLFCAPVVFPWYLLSLLPFLTTASTLLIVVWSASIVPTYVQWHLRATGHPWGALPAWTMLLEYACVAIAAAVLVLRRTDRSAVKQSAATR